MSSAQSPREAARQHGIRYSPDLDVRGLWRPSPGSERLIHRRVRAFGLKHLDYTHQERPAGIADALGLARYFADDDAVAVILGDNIFEFLHQTCGGSASGHKLVERESSCPRSHIQSSTACR
jgi:hypothetical protein